MSQLHRLLQLKCVKDWVGGQEVRTIFMKHYSNAVKVFVVEDCIKNVAFVCQDVVMVYQYPRDTSRRKELFEQGYMIGKSSGHGCNCLADSVF